MAQSYNGLEYNTEGYSSTNLFPPAVAPISMTRYNQQEYNEHQYHQDGVALLLSLPSDTLSVTDELIKTVNAKVLVGTIAFNESLTKTAGVFTSDFMSIQESFIKTVDTKGFADSIDLDLWLNIDKNDGNSSWAETS